MDTREMARSLLRSYLRASLACWRRWVALGNEAEPSVATYAKSELASVAVTVAREHGVTHPNVIRATNDQVVGRGFFEGKTCFFKYFANSPQRREMFYRRLMSEGGSGVLVRPFRVAPGFIVMPDAGITIQEVLQETHSGQRTTDLTPAIAALNSCPQFLDHLNSELLRHFPDVAPLLEPYSELNKYLMRVTVGGLQHIRTSPLWTALIGLMFIKRGGLSKVKGAFQDLPQLTKALKISPCHNDLHTTNVLMSHYNQLRVVDFEDIGFGFTFLEESFFLLHVANDVAPGALHVWIKIVSERIDSVANHQRAKAALVSLMLVLISLSPGYSGEPIWTSIRRQKSLFWTAEQLETLYGS